MELKSEVMQTFTRLWLMTSRQKSAELDTTRTSLTLELFRAKASEGQISSTELNRAQISRNNALITLGQVNTELIREKIYFGFLTGIAIDRLMNEDYDFSVFENSSFEYNEVADWDMLPEVTGLRLKSELLGRQVATERNMYMPRLGLEGFLGTNQYSYEFDPLKNTTWYGTSYIGLNIKLPIITGDNKVNRIKQLKLQTGSVNAQLTDLMNQINTTNLQLGEELMQLEAEIAIIEQNVALLNSNLTHYQARMKEGRTDADELLGQQTELKKEIERLNEAKASLALKKIEIIVSSGRTDVFIASLRN
jgi:outer membrane protein TolC